MVAVDSTMVATGVPQGRSEDTPTGGSLPVQVPHGASQPSFPILEST